MFALTPRLTLRPGWPEDARALAVAIGHEQVVRSLARAPWPYRVEDARDFLSLPCAANEARFQIIERTGAFPMIGGIGLVPLGHGVAELGYWLAPEAWGRGYATEAGRAVVDIARQALGLHRLVACHYVDNPASGGVLRKLGFTATGPGFHPSLARGTDVPCINFVLNLRDAEPAMPVCIAA